MCSRYSCVSTLTALPMMIFLAVPFLFAADKELKPSQKWSGSLDNEALENEVPAARLITGEKVFSKLWTAWKLGDKVPEVDFRKELVLVETTRGGLLNVNVRLTDDGDLKVLAAATRDLRPGFRYQILVVPREGIKTVNGKELPKGE